MAFSLTVCIGRTRNEKIDIFRMCFGCWANVIREFEYRHSIFQFNHSNQMVKITVQGVLWPQGATNPLAAGGHMITVGANAEATTMWLSGGTNAQNGDMLQVHKKFIMGSCNESNEDCGYKGSNNITIPNSRSF